MEIKTGSAIKFNEQTLKENNQKWITVIDVNKNLDNIFENLETISFEDDFWKPCVLLSDVKIFLDTFRRLMGVKL